MSPVNRRKKRWIEPRIQNRFVLIFLSTAALAVLVQSLVVSYLVVDAADRLPNDALLLKAQVGTVLVRSLLVTVAFLVPLTVFVGVASTHRIVGPLYRIRVYLTELAAGLRPEPCRIRKNDELQDLCALLNRATEPLRRAPADEKKEDAA